MDNKRSGDELAKHQRANMIFALDLAEVRQIASAPDGRVFLVELREQLEAAIDTLSPEEAFVVRARFFCGLTIKETARRLRNLELGRGLPAQIGDMSRARRVQGDAFRRLRKSKVVRALGIDSGYERWRVYDTGWWH